LNCLVFVTCPKLAEEWKGVRELPGWGEAKGGGICGGTRREKKRSLRGKHLTG